MIAHPLFVDYGVWVWHNVDDPMLHRRSRYAEVNYMCLKWSRAYWAVLHPTPTRLSNPSSICSSTPLSIYYAPCSRRDFSRSVHGHFHSCLLILLMCVPYANFLFRPLPPCLWCSLDIMLKSMDHLLQRRHLSRNYEHDLSLT